MVAISDKFKDVKVTVSLGLPRVDASLNRKVEKTNVLIKENNKYDGTSKFRCS